MIPAITSLGPLAAPAAFGPAGGAVGGAPESGSPSFKDFLVDSIRQVNAMQQDAEHAVEGLMTGADVNPAEVLTAVQKADMAFRMLMQIRNKLVQAYNEVQNIRV